MSIKVPYTFNHGEIIMATAKKISKEIVKTEMKMIPVEFKTKIEGVSLELSIDEARFLASLYFNHLGVNTELSNILRPVFGALRYSDIENLVDVSLSNGTLRVNRKYYSYG